MNIIKMIILREIKFDKVGLFVIFEGIKKLF